MFYSTNNLLIGNGAVMNSKFKFHFSIRNIFLLLYSVWVICSIFLAATHPNKYAALFTDLPLQLKNFPPFVLSLAYLILFVPAVASIILYALWVLLYTILKRLEQ